jgi:signal transduction histidine kinase
LTDDQQHQARFQGEEARPTGAAAEQQRWPAGWTERLHRLKATLSGVTDASALARITVEEGVDVMGVDAGVVFLLSADGDFLEIAHASGYPVSPVTAWQRFPVSVQVPVADALRSRQPVIIRSRDELNTRYPVLASSPNVLEHSTWVSLPLLVDQVCFGVFGLSFVSPQRLEEPELGFFRVVVDQCAQALHRARLVERDRLSTARLRVLARASRVFAAANPDVTSVYQAVADEVVASLGTSCTIALLSPDGEWLDAVAHRDIDPEAEERLRAVSRNVRIRRGEGFVGRAEESGQSLLIPELTSEALASGTIPALRERLEGLEVRSLLIAPIKTATKSIGTISTWQRFPGKPFAEEDRTLLEDLADRAALAIENARLHEREREARDRAQNADRQKDEFLAMLGHELRNPLAPISVAVQIMRELPLPDERLAWARETIGRQVEQFARLLDDLLDVSRIAVGKVELRLQPLDLAVVVQQAVEACRPLLTERRHQLSTELEATPVQGDAARLTQVISNLLNNAGKYTDPGGQIRLTVRRENGEAVVTVADNGIGIPGELIGQVFDRFVQVDDARRRSKDGLGIGLTLVKRLVEMHGGSVQATSAGEGRGSEFVVRLPALLGAGAVLEPGGAPRDPRAPPLFRRRILVADDTIDFAEGLRRLLGLQGHQVEVVHDGADALEAARRLDPDVVVLDIDLPGLSGVEIARRLRRGPDVRRPLLVAITGMGREEDRKDTSAAGFDHHLVKPIDLTRLSGLIGAWQG